MFLIIVFKIYDVYLINNLCNDHYNNGDYNGSDCYRTCPYAPCFQLNNRLMLPR